jgi:GNAT superfamily N-acetyltransferase
MKVRELCAGDANKLSKLITQLGYETSDLEVAERIANLSLRDDHWLFGLDDGGLVASIHFYIQYSLERGPEIVVQSLIVDMTHRRKGYGQQLLTLAERYAKEQGLAAISLRSNTLRADAHSFYRTLGYEAIGASTLFKKSILW